jgi:hypothetical protein
LAIQFLKRVKPTLVNSDLSLSSFTFILFSNEVSTSTTAYTSDQLVQGVSLKTNSVNETLSTNNASLEVVQKESTVDDPQSSKTEDPPVAATAGESIATVKDKKTPLYHFYATIRVANSQPFLSLGASSCV